MKRRNAMISGRIPAFTAHLRPVLEVRLEVEVDEAVAQRPRHREVHATLGGRIAGGDHHPAVRQTIFTELAIEHQLIAACLCHLRCGGELVEKEDALARSWAGTSAAPTRPGRPRSAADPADRPDQAARRAHRGTASSGPKRPGRRSVICRRRRRPRYAGAHVGRSAHAAPQRVRGFHGCPFGVIGQARLR